MSDVLIRQEIAMKAGLMREFRRSDGWGVIEAEIDARRDALLRQLEDRKDLGLESVSLARGWLQALTWASRLPDEIIGRHDRQREAG